MVGGIDAGNIGAFLDAGASGAGIGGNLVNHQWVEAGKFEKITAAAQSLVAAVKEC